LIAQAVEKMATRIKKLGVGEMMETTPECSFIYIEVRLGAKNED
jgi:hypothetical protein